MQTKKKTLWFQYPKIVWSNFGILNIFGKIKMHIYSLIRHLENIQDPFSVWLEEPIHSIQKNQFFLLEEAKELSNIGL